jgi:hypothetical protein
MLTGNYTLEPASTTGLIYKILTNNENEYFLLENRQKLAQDQYIPGEGLAIWHIDESVQDDNNIVSHKKVDLEEADGKDQLDKDKNNILINNGNSGDKGDLFPGSGNVTIFNSKTYPNSNLHSGLSSLIDIHSISEDGSIITLQANIKDITDKTPPHITSAVYAEDNLYANVTLYFSEPIDESTLVSSNFIFQGSKTGKQSFGIKYWPEFKSCTLFPTEPFVFGEDVYVTVTSGVTDINENGLDGDGDGSTGPNYVYTFNTGSYRKDYSVENIALSKDNPVIDDVIDVTATIKNTGVEAPSVNSKIVLYDNGALVDEYLSFSVLQPGGERSHTFTWRCTQGAHNLEIRVELEGDQNTDNNSKIKQVYGNTESELVIDGEQNPSKLASLYPGKKINYSLKLQNTGTALMFADVTKEGSQAAWLSLNDGMNKTVSAGDTETYSCSISVPSGTSVGEYNAVLKFTFDNGLKSATVNFTIKVSEFVEGLYTGILETGNVLIDGSNSSTTTLTHMVSDQISFLLDNYPDATFPIYEINEVNLTQDKYNRLNEATWSIANLIEYEGYGKIRISGSERSNYRSYSSTSNPSTVDILEWFDSGVNELKITLDNYSLDESNIKWYVNNSTQKLYFSRAAWGKDYSVGATDINKWEDGFDYARLYFDVENVYVGGDLILFNNGNEIATISVSSSDNGKTKYFNLSTSSLTSSSLETSNYFSIKGDSGDDTKVNISNITLEVKYFDGDPNLLCTKTIESEEININESVTVNLNFENIGSNIADNPRFNDSSLPDGLVLSSGSISGSIIDLNPEETTVKSYTIKGIKAGTYVFGKSNVTYQDKGNHDYISEFNAVTLKVYQGNLLVGASMDAITCYEGEVISIQSNITESVGGGNLNDAIVTCEISSLTLGYNSLLYMTYDESSGLYQVGIPKGLSVGVYNVVVEANKENYRTGVSTEPLTFEILAEPFLNVDPLSKNVLSDDIETTFHVSTNVDWMVSENVDWISDVNKIDNSTFNVTFNVNEGFQYRNGAIVVSSEYTPDVQVILSQEGKEIVNNPPTVILEVQPITLDEDFDTYKLPQKLSETFNDDGNLTFRISANQEIVGVQLVGDEIQLRSIQDLNGNCEVTIIANDGEFEVNESFTVNINPVNDSPKVIGVIQDIEIQEDAPDYLVDQALSSIFSDVDNTVLSYSIQQSGSSISIEINGEDKLQLKALSDQYGENQVVVIASDGELSAQTSFTITVLPVNDPPIIEEQLFILDEHPNNGLVIGHVIASDIENDQLSYQIINQTVNNTLIIDSQTGELVVNDSTALDYEQRMQYHCTVKVTDNGEGALSEQADVTIELNNVSVNDLFLSDMEAYPIPVKDYLNLKFPSDENELILIKVVSVNGATVYNEHVSLSETKHLQIDFRHLESGIYLVNLKAKEGLRTLRVAKE